MAVRRSELRKAAKPTRKPKTSKTNQPAAEATEQRRSAAASRRKSPIRKRTETERNLGKPSRPDVKVFIESYLRDPNGRQAAIAAGYSEASADSTASRLLKNAKVRAEIDKVQQARIEKVQIDTGITLERTIKEIARLAYFDVRELYGPNGEIRPIHELDDDTAAALTGIDVQQLFGGAGEDRAPIGVLMKWRAASKEKALDMLMKHLGGYLVDNTQKVSSVADAVGAFIAAIHTSGGSSLPIRAPK